MFILLFTIVISCIKFHLNILCNFLVYLVSMRVLVILILGLYLAGEQCHGQNEPQKPGRGRKQFKCTECREGSNYDPYVCQSCFRGTEGDEPFTCTRCKVGGRSKPFICQRCEGETTTGSGSYNLNHDTVSIEFNRHHEK